MPAALHIIITCTNGTGAGLKKKKNLAIIINFNLFHKVTEKSYFPHILNIGARDRASQMTSNSTSTEPGGDIE